MMINKVDNTSFKGIKPNTVTKIDFAEKLKIDREMLVDKNIFKEITGLKSADVKTTLYNGVVTKDGSQYTYSPFSLEKATKTFYGDVYRHFEFQEDAVKAGKKHLKKLSRKVKIANFKKAVIGFFKGKKV